MKETLTDICTALGVSVERARHLARGGAPASDAETLAAPALRHAYTSVHVPAVSTSAAYEAGLRLLSADLGAPVARRTTSGRWKWTNGGRVLLTSGPKKALFLDGVAVHARAAHDTLAAHVETISVPPAVFMDKRSTLTALADLVAETPAPNPRVLALLGWWNDAADHAGNGVAVDMLATLDDMYAVATTPENLSRWRRIIGTDTDGIAGLIEAHSFEIGAFDTGWLNRWGALRRSADEGWASRRESAVDMSASMESMTSAGDWWMDYGISTDPLIQDREVWSGRVVPGTWHAAGPSSWTFAAGDASCRYRAGSEVTVILHVDGAPKRRVNVEVADLGWDATAGLLVTVRADGRPNNARDLDRCFSFDEPEDRSRVVMVPQRPTPDRASEARERAVWARRSADQRSWLKDTNRVPDRTAREVPFDVYAAAVGC